MHNRKSSPLAVAMLIGSFLAGATAQVSTGTAYPRVDLRPAQPAAEDIVELRLVLGLASSSCVAPTYTDTSFVIRLLDGGARPPLFSVDLSYTEVPPPPDRICPAIYDPTEYGPSYRLGALPEGTYIVKDGNTAVDTFTVTAEPVTPRIAITGTVFENTGALPVVRTLPGVTVYLQVHDIIYVDPIPLGEMPWPPYVTLDTTVTDRSGAYAFSGLEPQSYRLVFVSAGHQTHCETLVPQADTVVDVWLLPLDASVTINGTVYEGCARGTECLWTPPLAGCTVSVSILIPMMEFAKGQEAGGVSALTAVTDAQGRYAIPGVPVYDQAYAAYQVTARKAGFVAQSKMADVQYGIGPTVDFVMEPSVLAAGGPGSPSHGRRPVQVTPDGSAVRFALGTQETVRCRAYGLDGRSAPDLSFERLLPPGSSTVTLPPDLAPGVYLLRVTADGREHVLDLRVGR